jgi:mannosyltransferase
VRVAGRELTKYTIAVLVIVLVGAFLRLYHIGAQSLGADDTWSVWVSKLSLHDIVQTTSTDVHPPLYYFLLHYWMAYFGTSELAVKLPSIVFGVLSIIVVYALGRQLFDERAGLLAAFILAVSSFNIRYSQEVRMYSLLVLLGLLSMYFFIRLSRRSTPLTWAGYVISTTLLLYTHAYGLFLLIAQNLYVVSLLVVSRKDAFWWRRWLVLELVVIVLFAPWVPVLIHQTGATSSGQQASFWLALQHVGATVVATLTSYADGTLLLLAIFLVLSVLSLVTCSAADDSTSLKAPLQALRRYVRGMRVSDVHAQCFLIVWFLTVLFLPIALSLFSRLSFEIRYTIAASIALYLLVAKGVVNIKPRTVQLAVVFVIVVLSAVNVQAYVNNQLAEGWAKEAWVQSKETFSVINQQGRNGDLVVLYPQFLWSVNKYYDNVNGINATLLKVGPTIQDINTLYAHASKNDRVWFVVYSYDAPPTTVEKSVLSAFNQTHSIAYVKNYEGYRIYLLERRA